MVVYNFKSIGVVPSSKEFVDIILSRTQRKTPTVVHKGYAISRIRRFYMRKVKFTQEGYHERISQILDEFPRLDDIHPFYADLINVLYSKDHYKLALGQLSTARTTVDNIGRDYLKLLKYGDSLYRCKELKRAALGRMCTVVSKLGASLQYLEQVRQHLSRLPQIDPNSRTLLITGYPNVGKSSFINKLTNANVEVQPYAFTTKSLFVGHFDYKYVRWQVIDTPGILDHPLEERNTIEMQAITALAHLHATILFMVDISEQCGYSIKQQADLFHSIKPLFVNKPLLIVANKIDVKTLESLSPEDRSLLDGMTADRNTRISPMSNQTEQGIADVTSTACDMLLQMRVERKLTSTRKNGSNDVLNRLQVTVPTPRDNKTRATSIPESVIQARMKIKSKASKAKSLNSDDEEEEGDEDNLDVDDSTASSSSSSSSSSASRIILTSEREALEQARRLEAYTRLADPNRRKLASDLEREHGGAGVFNFDQRSHWQLSNNEWAHDYIPEIMDGKNVADFFDPDIAERLDQLEKEEEELERQWQLAMANGELAGEESDLDEETSQQVQQVRDTKKVLRLSNRLAQNSTGMKPVPRRYRVGTITEAASDLSSMGKPTTAFIERAKSKTRGIKRSRDAETDEAMERERAAGQTEGDDMTVESTSTTRKTRSKSREASTSRSRSKSHQRTPAISPFRNVRQKQDAEKLARKMQRARNQDARIGEADRRVFDYKPKHLFSGKISMGSRDRR